MNKQCEKKWTSNVNKSKFLDQLIGCGGPTQPPDMTPLDFFYWVLKKLKTQFFKVFVKDIEFFSFLRSLNGCVRIFQEFSRPL